MSLRSLAAVFCFVGWSACGGVDDSLPAHEGAVCDGAGDCEGLEGTEGSAGDGAENVGTGDESPQSDLDSGESGPGFACPEITPGSTVGVLNCSDGLEPGYTLFAPIRSTTTYLVDVGGRVVHSWESDHRPGLSVYLLEDGRLLRTINTSAENNSLRGGGAAGGIEILDWDSSVLWRYSYNTDDYRSHHDVEYLPNGNILMYVGQ